MKTLIYTVPISLEILKFRNFFSHQRPIKLQEITGVGPTIAERIAFSFILALI